MKHTRLWVATAIIAGVIFASFLFTAPHTRDVVDTTRPPEAASTAPAVSIHDAFKKGTHTITGSILAPTPCTTITSSATSSAERITVDISMPKDSGVCLQENSKLSFSTTVSAPAGIPIIVVVNGEAASTTDL